MNLGPWQLVIIALIILVLFGRGRISEMMGDFGQGIKSFKKGMADEEHSSTTTPANAAPPQQIEHERPTSTASSAPAETKTESAKTGG